MKKLIALLVIAQFICLSQSAQVKKASDACPGSNNKSSTSKEYAHLSKRSAAKDNSDFSKPKYQSIYAKNTNANANTSSRRGKSVAKEERIVNQASIRPKKETAPVIKEEKNNSSKVSSEPEAEFVESTPSEKKMETSKPMDVIQTEKAVASEPKSETTKPEPTNEEGKTATSKKSDKRASKSGSTKSTDLNTTKEAKQKQQKKTTAKKLRLGKKCANDCPEF